jgi:hypothetical protein
MPPQFFCRHRPEKPADFGKGVPPAVAVPHKIATDDGAGAPYASPTIPDSRSLPIFSRAADTVGAPGYSPASKMPSTTQ